MYCRQCGQQIDDRAPACPACGAPTGVSSGLPGDEKTWAMLCHLLPLIFLCTSFYVSVLAPLVILLVKGQDSPLIEDQARESLNFHISLMIYGVILLLVALTIVGLIIAIPGAIALVIFQIVVMIVASVSAGNGERYRYPLCIRFLK